MRASYNGLGVGPLDELNQLIAAFMDIPRRIAVARERARKIQLSPTASIQAKNRANEVAQELATLSNDWNWIRAKFDIRDAESGRGLGIAPVVYAVLGGVTLVTALATVRAIFRRQTAAEKTLDLVEKGILTPQQGEDYLRNVPHDTAHSLAATAKYALLAVLGFVGYNAWTNRRGA